MSKANKLKNSIEVLIFSINFISISYLLLSALHSFKSHPLFILLFACNCWLISQFKNFLSKLIPNKKLNIFICILNIILILTIIFHFGYISMSIPSLNI